jgi:hypothetical protein
MASSLGLRQIRKEISNELLDSLNHPFPRLRWANRQCGLNHRWTMTTKFELRLIVPAKLVGTIVELVEGEGILVSMTPSYAKPNHRSSPIHRTHIPGLTADGLMQEYLASLKSKEQFTNRDVEKVFKDRGYSPKSASSRLSACVSKKQAKRLGHTGRNRAGLYEKV